MSSRPLDRCRLVPRLAVAAAATTLAVLALLAAGSSAALAAAAGAGLAWIGQVALIEGLSAVLGRPRGRRARRAALVGFVLRHALAGLLIYVLLVRLEMPAGWLVAGLSLWPLTLLAEIRIASRAEAAAAAEPHPAPALSSPRPT